MKSMSHVSGHEERLRLAGEREQETQRLVGVLRQLRDKIDRKDQLLQGYERDLARLRFGFTFLLTVITVFSIYSVTVVNSAAIVSMF